MARLTLLTTEANALKSVVHNSKKRMPVIINPKAEKEWLDNGKLEMFNDFLQTDPLKPAQEQLGLWADNN